MKYLGEFGMIESREIVDYLETNKIPYEIREEGQSILDPSKFQKVRILVEDSVLEKDLIAISELVNKGPKPGAPRELKTAKKWKWMILNFIRTWAIYCFVAATLLLFDVNWLVSGPMRILFDSSKELFFTFKVIHVLAALFLVFSLAYHFLGKKSSKNLVSFALVFSLFVDPVFIIISYALMGSDQFSLGDYNFKKDVVSIVLTLGWIWTDFE